MDPKIGLKLSDLQTAKNCLSLAGFSVLSERGAISQDFGFRTNPVAGPHMLHCVSTADAVAEGDKVGIGG